MAGIPWTDEEEAVAERLYSSGASWTEILAALPGRTRNSVNYQVQKGKWERGYRDPMAAEIQGIHEKHKPLVAFLKDAPHTLSEVSARFDRSAETCRGWVDELMAAGYNVIETQTTAEVSTKALPPSPIVERMLRFSGLEFTLGVISDLHFGSSAEQTSALHAFTRRAYDAGVRHMLVSGDIFAGYGVYKGQANDLYIVRADGQIAAASSRIPQYDDMDWYLLGGNHDYAYIKGGGPCGLRALCAMRPDMHFVGYDAADIPITDRVDCRLWHPRGGIPYATCLSDDTQILTKRGWVGFDTINMADSVATLNPATGELEYQCPEELFIERYEGPMIHFHSRTVDHLVTPQHDLWARPYNEGAGTGAWRKMKAADLIGAKQQQWQMRMTVDSWDGEDLEAFSAPFHEWSGARDLGEMPIDDFLTFLGWYVSEGHIQARKSICISQLDGQAVESIQGCMERIGLHTKVYPHSRYLQKRTGQMVETVVVRGNNASLARWLTEHVGKGAKTKRVPRFVMDLPRERILTFLQALFAGDGTKSPNRALGYCTYNSASTGLTGDVQELLLKVGLAGTVGTRTVGVLEQNMPTINTRPKSVPYSGIVWCVRVPNGLVYARRNGKPVWTGNSYRLQKGMESMAYEALQQAIAEDSNPRLRLVVAGHIHVTTMLPIGGVVGFQAGCFEMQNNFLRALGRFPSIGGWIVRVRLEDSGWIAGITGEWVPFRPVVDDWKNYPMPQELAPKVEPLFSV